MYNSLYVTADEDSLSSIYEKNMLVILNLCAKERDIMLFFLVPYLKNKRVS